MSEAITLVNKKPWQFITVDWFSSAFSNKRWTSRLSATFSFGWHVWGFGISVRVAGKGKSRSIHIVVGPLLVGAELLPVPVCPCCGEDPDEPSEDCAAHPSATETEP